MIREPAPAPPKGFRPHMSAQTKLEAALIALGLEPKLVEFQHDPPLHLRVWVPEKNDTDPPANDPRHIIPMAKEDHRRITAKVDVPAIAKTRRLSAKQESFRSRMLAKTTGDADQDARVPSRNPLPGSKASGWRKKLNGEVVRR